MNFDFLGDIWSGIGNIGADTDKFMKREMPFDSGWGAPAALVASYFAAPYVASSFGAAEGAGAVGGAEGGGALGGGELVGGGSGGFTDYLSSLFGGESGGTFVPSIDPSTLTSSDTGALNQLAADKGVSLGEPSLWDRITGNTEQGLYDKNSLATMSLKDKLKQQAQSQALSQLMKSGQSQSSQAQQQPQMMPVAPIRLKQGQAVDTTSPLLSLLAERQALRNPRISLI